ncbi:ABC transporter ATP-binding protein [Spiroplasma endosymbiont of Polydrusus pterygomalis]|uniref:ATP-binding cassette domain-containing protein n=1 Tax=Spiroplasma endosymbiont of Polydrusus pterygomalis TaxID=3139327 RepID=UPI003CCB3120
MGLKINNLKYKRYKKVIFADLNFDVNSQEVLGTSFEDKFLQLYFLKLLLGRKKPRSGKIYLNNRNITALLPKERKIGYVSPGALRLSFLPTKLRLAYHILKTPKFLHDSSLKYNKNKYFYKKLVFIGNDLNKQELILKIDKIINEYFNNSIRIKEEWIETYLTQISEFHKKEINKILDDDKDSILIQSLHTYTYKREEIRVYEGYLAFLQALWDKIYYISDLDYLCDCYEIAKKRKLKDKSFFFIGAKLVCEKYLKILHTEITYERYLLIKARKALKKYRFNVVNTVMKDTKRKSIIKGILNKSNSSNIITWSKLSKNQWFNYNQNQEQLIANLLPDEATIVKGKVLEFFHKYHLELLGNTLKPREKDNSIAIAEAIEKVVTVYNQAFEEVKKLMSDLDIKMNWFKLTKNLSSFDHTKIRLINAILSNKELIVLHNTFDNLTHNEANELNDILLNLKNYNPQLTFLVLTKNVENIKNYVTQLLIFDKDNNYKLMSKDHAEYSPDTIELYQAMYNSSENVFAMKYVAAENTLANEKIKIKLPKGTKLIDKKKYWLAINPNLITFKRTKNFNKDLHLAYKGHVKTIKKIAKSIVCFFKINDDIVFKKLVTEKELNLKRITTIYFEKQALLVYDKVNSNLVANI